MNSVAIVDTSVLCELLAVPGKSGVVDQTRKQLEEKSRAGERLFLPLAAVFETGNHIGQVADGTVRRKCAELLAKLVIDALDQNSPFVPMQLPEPGQIRAWVDEFPAWVGTKSGLGDLSIKHDWERLCRLHRGRRVYIWSLDVHLSSFDRAPEV